ncbi:MAG TPA: SPFH domain-containing protein [Gemmatimonadales bacterium]|nr:SPFH domain-containing protein [Gemmatimonadales bacterium]
MGTLVLGGVLLLVGLIVRSVAKSTGSRAAGSLISLVSIGLIVAAGVALLGSTLVIIEPGQVGVQHAFGKVRTRPLLAGVHLIPPWAEVERYSTREEQWPSAGEEAERMAALSSEQMGMTVDVAVRWQIDPLEAPRIFTEIGREEQIHAVVVNAIRNGVRDGMVTFSINDIAQRNRIAEVMRAEVDSALVTAPRGGGPAFRVATLTAFFLRDLQPPAQVIAAINNKIAQEQQIATERHRVEVARLQSEQQKLLNLTLTPEALMKQYLEVLHEMRTSNNLVVLVPTEGGVPLLDLAALRRNVQSRPQQ